MTLRDDNDTAALKDGRTARLRIEHDEAFTIEDMGPEAYGLVAWDSHRTNDYGYPERPDGFDGNAEKVSTSDGRDRFWWQPPADLCGGWERGGEHFPKLRSLVADLVTYGFHVVTVEVLDGIDAYNRPIVVAVASLGGIDSLDDGYLDDVVGELLGELDAEVADEEREGVA